MDLAQHQQNLNTTRGPVPWHRDFKHTECFTTWRRNNGFNAAAVDPC
jgi:hypothetical protein